MNNASLRLTTPVWSEEVDDGGMFSSRVSVHEDPDGGSLPFLAVYRTSWSGGGQARRASLAEARSYAWVLREKVLG